MTQRKILDMGNATDDDLERLIVFACSVARMSQTSPKR